MRKRSMSLTPELVGRCERPEPDPGPNPDFTPIDPEELDTVQRGVVNTRCGEGSRDESGDVGHSVLFSMCLPDSTSLRGLGKISMGSGTYVGDLRGYCTNIGVDTGEAVEPASLKLCTC